MKVDNINPIGFRSVQYISRPDNIMALPVQETEKKPSVSVNPVQTNELRNSILDYNIKTPQKYNKLGVTEFAGGLKLHSYKLANGYRISIIPIEGSPTTVKNYVNVGSLNETDDIKGISHFLEHMAFNGTTGENGYLKLNAGDSFKNIDKLGGWTNASTSYALTDYVNSTPMLEEKDLEEQIKVIASMTEDLALTEEMIEKEKGPVCSEIDMILDNPQTLLCDQTVRTLFNIKSSADELIGGSTEHIKNLTREKVKAYYDKYYTPDNMNLVITGDVDPDKVIELVSKNFHSKKVSSGNRYEEKLTPINKTVRKDFISEKAVDTTAMLGFVGPKNNDAKSKIIYDILDQHLGSTSVGLGEKLKDINAYSIFDRDKVSTYQNGPTILLFGLNSSEENSEKALKIVFNKLSNLKAPDEKELSRIKEGLLQSYKNAIEHSNSINNVVGKSIISGNLDYALNYENLLNDITSEDIQNYIDKYIDLNKCALTVIHPKTTEEKILENHQKASSLSFKGERKPLNTDKVTESTLANNYKIAFHETNNDNVFFMINHRMNPSKTANPAVEEVLFEILDMGTSESDETAFKKYQEENNISVGALVANQCLFVSGSSSYANFEKTVDKAKELLYNPRINEETVKTAINRIKDGLNRSQDSASSLYSENEAKINHLYTSRKEILEKLDSVTVEDVKNLHKHILENSSGFIVMNSPKQKDIKSKALDKFSELNNVNTYRYILPEVYVDNTETQVLTKEKPTAQADIMQVNKFKLSKTIKEDVGLEIMNTLLSSSASIGLFSVLREKEQLAYSVSSNLTKRGDSGEIRCRILTTTDNKEKGNTSYENVQKSIDGFNRQIQCLLNSEYTDEDLESAKRILKAELLDKETTWSKLDSVKSGMGSKYGINYENMLYDEIDKITREDIKALAEKVFKNKPIYSIVASKDTLEANKDYFETL